MYIIFTAVLFIAITIGIIALQVYLSKSSIKWLGLILPILILVISLFTAASVPFTVTTSTTTQTYNEQGDLVDQTVTEGQPEMVQSLSSVIMQSAYIIFTINIPGLILFLIYKSVRKSQKASELDKMRMQDL